VEENNKTQTRDEKKEKGMAIVSPKRVTFASM
jgi:hypothetical protein